MVPVGSLNVDMIKTPQKPESAERDTKTIARGWKLEGFNAAANKLLRAASRLESEVAAETRYWDEVLAVKNTGWKVCRLPRERQALGVQYGFLEGLQSFTRMVLPILLMMASYAHFPRPRSGFLTTS
jgi:mediator of RNA polymerase II transcription subunit 17